MFRVTLGLATATFFGLAAVSPASAGCCGSNWGWGGGWGAGWGVNSWGSGCCNRSVVYAQPQYFVQPAAPIIVQAPAQQIIVQQPQPEVIFQQQAPVASYSVDQGPFYAGPQSIGYSQPEYFVNRPVRAFPYAPGYYNPNRFYGRPFHRGWRGAGYRGYRGVGIYRGGYSRRTVAVHTGRYHRGVTVRRSWN